MNGINLWNGVGRLGATPILKKTKTGISVTDVVLVVNSYAGKDTETGEVKEKTLYLNATAYGNQADYLYKYGRKGGLFAVLGRLDNNNYEKEDKKVYSVTLKIETVLLLDKADKEK